MTTALTFPNPETHARRIGGDDGTVSRKDISDFQIATRRVHALMRDGQWHSAQTIIEASGIREGLRRMRELRQLNYRIERMRVGQSRDWHYRLVIADTDAPVPAGVPQAEQTQDGAQ